MKIKTALIVTAAAAWFFIGQSAPAADASWNVNAAGSWITNGSWNPAAAPGSVTTNNTDVATFSFTLTADRLVTVDANRFIGGLSFGNTSAFKYTLQTGILHLNNGGAIQTLAANGNHTDTISSAIVIEGDGGAATFTAGATSATSLLSIGAVTGVSSGMNVTTLTLNGTNTGANAITGIIGNGSLGGKLAVVKDGAGTWTLSGSNTYSGGTTISAGTLQIGSAGTLAAAAVITNNGVLQYSSSATQTISGIISGSGSLIKDTSTTSTLTLSVANTFTGGLFIKAGAVALGDVNAANGVNNIITIGDATVGADATLKGNKDAVSFLNPITVASGSGTRTIGVGTGNIGAVFNGNITLNHDLIVAQTATAGNKGMALGGTITGTGNISLQSASGGGLTLSGASINNIGSITNAATGTGSATISGTIGSNVTGLNQNSLTSALVLKATNTYTAATTVNAGILMLGNGGSLAATPVTVNPGGTLAIAQTASSTTNALTGSITLLSNAAFTMADTKTSTFNVTGASTLAPASGAPTNLTFDIIGANTDLLAIAGSATVGAAGALINISPASTPTAGNTYTIITGGGGSALTTNITLASPLFLSPTGPLMLSLSNSSPTTAKVTVGADGNALYWSGAAGSTWNTAGNWNTGVSNNIVSGSTPGSSNDLVFSTTSPVPANLTNTLGADTSVNSVNFLAGAASVTVNAGNNLTINGGGITKSSINAQTINAPIILGAAQTWINNAAATLTIAGGVTGACNLTINPNSTGGITLTSANNTGTIIINGAGTGATTITTVGSNVSGVTQSGISPLTITTLNMNAGGTTLTSTGTSLLTISNSPTGVGALSTTVNNAGGITFTGGANNTGAITNNGSGKGAVTYSGAIGSNVTSVTQNSTTSVLVLSGSNSYPGPTAINGGIVKISAANNLGDSTKATNTISFNNGGTLESTANTYDLGSNRTITLNGAGTIQSDAGTLTVSGAIGGPGNLTKTGTGTVILSGLSSYGGTTTITQGTLRLAGNGAALGNIMPTGDSITYGLHGTNAGYRGPLYNLMQTAGYSSQYVGGSNGNTGSLPPNQTAHDGNSGWIIAQVLNGVTPSAQGGLGWMSANPQIITLLIGINDRNLNDGTDVSMVPGLMIQYGNLIDSIFQQNPTVRLYVGKLTPCNAYVTTFNASLVTLIQAKQAAGYNIAIVDLNTNFPANGLYDGIHPNDTGYSWMAQQWFNAISADHPVVSANILPVTTAVSLASGTTLDLDGVSQTIASLSDSGTTAITNSFTVIPVKLTINPPAGSTTYSGAISDSGTANAISLVKSGAGTQALAGTNSYSGGTTITGGILNISADTNLGATAGALTFSGGTLQLGAGVTINASRLVTLTASGGVIDTQANTGTIAAAIGGAGGLTKVGTGTLTLTGSNNYAGATTVTAGTLSLATPGLADAANVYLTTGAVLNLNFSATDTIDALFIDGVCQPSGTWGAIGSTASHTTELITGSGWLNVTTGPSFESWINGFSSLSIADRALTANPSGDGINNLLKYALGGDPRVASPAILPQASPASGKLALTFTRTLANTDITMKVQASDSLTGPWADLASSVNGAPMSALIDGVVVSGETGTGTTRTVEVRDLYLTSDPTHPRRFMRLQVIH